MGHESDTTSRVTTEKILLATDFVETLWRLRRDLTEFGLSCYPTRSNKYINSGVHCVSARDQEREEKRSVLPLRKAVLASFFLVS